MKYGKHLFFVVLHLWRDGKQMFSGEKDLFSNGKLFFSNGKQLFSDEKHLFSNGKLLFSNGKDLFSNGKQLSGDGKQMFSDEKQTQKQRRVINLLNGSVHKQSRSDAMSLAVRLNAREVSESNFRRVSDD